MKKINFSIFDNDVLAISTALLALPACDCYETDEDLDIALQLAESAGTKLFNHQSPSNQEALCIAIAIDNAYLALRGELGMEEEALASLKPYLFTINKLHPIFSPLLDELS